MKKRAFTILCFILTITLLYGCRGKVLSLDLEKVEKAEIVYGASKEMALFSNDKSSFMVTYVKELINTREFRDGIKCEKPESYSYMVTFSGGDSGEMKVLYILNGTQIIHDGILYTTKEPMDLSILSALFCS